MQTSRRPWEDYVPGEFWVIRLENNVGSAVVTLGKSGDVKLELINPGGKEGHRFVHWNVTMSAEKDVGGGGVRGSSRTGIGAIAAKGCGKTYIVCLELCDDQLFAGHLRRP
jgi:hypothetical protein